LQIAESDCAGAGHGRKQTHDTDKSSKQRLVTPQHPRHDARLAIYCFDLLYLNGADLCDSTAGIGPVPVARSARGLSRSDVMLWSVPCVFLLPLSSSSL
jgi:hypothetical protein